MKFRLQLELKVCLFQGYMEPWEWTYYFSEDRISKRFSVLAYPNRAGTSFREVKAMLESKHEGTGFHRKRMQSHGKPNGRT